MTNLNTIAVYNRRKHYYQGDSIPALSLRLTRDGILLKPTKAELIVDLLPGKLEYLGDIREDNYIIFESINSSITKDLTPGRYEYQVRLEFQNYASTYLKGSFKILRSNKYIEDSEDLEGEDEDIN